MLCGGAAVPSDGLCRATQRFLGGAVWPGADTDAVARAVGERPVRWCLRLVNDAAARSECRLEARRDVLARDLYVEMHRVPQRLGLVELLHPDRRSLSKGVHRIIVSHRHLPEHRAPEPRSIASRFAAIASCTSWTAARSRPHRASARRPTRSARARRVAARVARGRDSAGGEAGIGDRQQHPRALAPWNLRTASARRAASPSDRTRKTAVAPPCRTTQSPTPLAARKSCQPCSLMLAPLTVR